MFLTDGQLDAGEHAWREDFAGVGKLAPDAQCTGLRIFLVAGKLDNAGMPRFALFIGRQLVRFR